MGGGGGGVPYVSVTLIVWHIINSMTRLYGKCNDITDLSCNPLHNVTHNFAYNYYLIK